MQPDRTTPPTLLERIEHWLTPPGRELALGAGLVALAFVLRVAHVLSSRASPYFAEPQMDALYHLEWARAFARGETFQPGPFFRAPLYPWLLGVVLRVFGDGLLVPRLLQAALGAATTLLAWRVARELFGRFAGLLSAALVAGYWVLIFYDGELLLECLCTPLYLLGVLATLRAGERGGRARGFVAGIAWGLGAITRPNVLPLAPLLALWLWKRPPAGLVPALLFLAGWCAPIAPITAYNLIAGHDRVLIASQGGVNLWIGNNPASDGTSAIVPGTREDWWGGHRDAIALAEQAEGRVLRPSEVSSYYTRRAFEFARDEPRAWLAGLARKLRWLWMDWELGNNEEVRFLAWRFSPLLRWLPLGYGVLISAALVGALLCARRRETWPLLAFVLVFGVSLVVFFVNARYRVPLLPAFAILASHAAVRALGALSQRRWKALAPGLAVFGLSLAVSERLPAGIEQRSRSNGWLMLGAAALRARQFEQAEELLRSALEADADNWIARRALAESHYFQGELPDALEQYQAALRLRPDDVFALEGLGRVHFKRRDLEAAARAFGRAAELNPRFFDALYSLGVVELERQRLPEAAHAFEAALAAEAPRDESFLADCFARAAQLEAQLGKLEHAARLLAQGRERFPADPRLESLERALERQ